jgi:prepilin-type N-terminal cleavage/methylation domain-containing protein
MFKRKSKGFTLIELLIVITLIGIVGGIMITTINVQYQKNIAEDSIREENLVKLAKAIESYYQYEGSYPTVANHLTALQEYAVKVWPEDVTYVEEDGEFSVYISKASDTAEYYKYSSAWDTTKLLVCGSTSIESPYICDGQGEVSSGSPGGDPGGGEVTLTSVSINPSEDVTLNIDDIHNLRLIGYYSNGAASYITTDATWGALVAGIVTVALNGDVSEVTALAEGQTSVNASYAGFSDSIAVEVLADPVEPPPDPPPAEDPVLISVSVQPDTATMYLDETLQLSAIAQYQRPDGSYFLDDVTDDASWSADAPLISMGSGSFVAKGTGNGVVATASFGGISGTCLVSIIFNFGF